MKTIKTASLFVLAIYVFCVAGPSSLLNASDTPTASEWEVASAEDPSLTITSDGMTAVTISIAARTAQSLPVICDLLVGGSDPSNVFTGNFAERGYSGVSFRTSGDGASPAVIELVIYQRFGSGLTSYARTWRHQGVGVSTLPGEWTICKIPFDLSSGWTTDYESTRYTDEELWARDMADVQTLIVRIVPDGLSAQSYSISDFRLFGEGVISEPAKLTSLQMLLSQFEVSSVSELTDAMIRFDSDGDGMSDYYEILAGMDPYDAASVFKADVQVGSGSNTIAWDGVLGLRYGVMRSNNLSEGFQLIQSAIDCRATGRMQYVDENPVDGKPNFYKVVKY